jgi:hypothetical protein
MTNRLKYLGKARSQALSCQLPDIVIHKPISPIEEINPSIWVDHENSDDKSNEFHQKYGRPKNDRF